MIQHAIVVICSFLIILLDDQIKCLFDDSISFNRVIGHFQILQVFSCVEVTKFLICSCCYAEVGIIFTVGLHLTPLFMVSNRQTIFVPGRKKRNNKNSFFKNFTISLAISTNNPIRAISAALTCNRHHKRPIAVINYFSPTIESFPLLIEGNPPTTALPLRIIYPGFDMGMNTLIT